MAQSPGTQLAHYTLVEKIGEGGMGEVWKARDGHLDRDVAIKLLTRAGLDDPEVRQRFRREAHVLARLSHPGVATIFDFSEQNGVDFLVMEYVPGGSLDALLSRGEALPLPEVLRLGVGIADALADAHKGGFLHRDLKAANVVLTDAGRPKLLDFGIAGLLHEGPGGPGMTMTGAVMGSLPYMAPEQILGGKDDERTDVYSLGVLLYEMATGRRPFAKDRDAALMFEILKQAAPPLRSQRPDAPDELDRLIASCLQKEPERRPATAAEVAKALRSISQAAASGAAAAAAASDEAIRSIAVLPLDNVTKDAAQDWFADGMTEALISDLASIKALRVISRTSVMKYKGARGSLPDIARELNVDAILEGSALLVGNRVRISVSLVSARRDETLWNARYERELSDVLSLQSDVAASVAKEIAVQVTPQEAKQLSGRGAVSAEAHVDFMKGLHELKATSPQAINLATRYFRRALEVDAEFAPAWAWMAEAHMIRASRGMAPPAEALAQGIEAAKKSLALNPDLAEGHMALGGLLLLKRDVHAGTKSLERAIELNPGLATSHYTVGRAYYMVERHAEAQAAMLKALSLDPLSMVIHTAVGDAYYYAREYEKSILYYSLAVELDSRFDGAHTDLARSLEAIGKFDEAREQYEEGRRLGGGVAGPHFGLAHLALSRGDEAEARRQLAELIAARSQRVVSAWGIAVLHACLGDVDDAFRWLETAIEEGATGLIFARVHPRLDKIRGDARYPALVKRLGLGP